MGVPVAAVLTRRVASLPLDGMADTLQHLADASRSANTWRAYRRDWIAFTAWCAEHGFPALPTDDATLAGYVALRHRRGDAYASIMRSLAAVAKAHHLAELPNPRRGPRLTTTLEGLRKAADRTPKRKRAVGAELLKRLLRATPGDGVRPTRDRALLVVGFLGGFRRSELVALDVADLEFVREGVKVTIRRSKTDREGRGEVVCLPYTRDAELCPVAALEAYIARAALTSGPLFRGCPGRTEVGAKRLDGGDVARIIKRVARAAEVGDVGDLAGHSLRRGFVTEAARRQVAERRIMKQTRHRSVMQMRAYIEEANVWDENAVRDMGL